jgi:hypothetical protein
MLPVVTDMFIQCRKVRSFAASGAGRGRVNRWVGPPATTRIARNRNGLRESQPRTEEGLGLRPAQGWGGRHVFETVISLRSRVRVQDGLRSFPGVRVTAC